MRFIMKTEKKSYRIALYLIVFVLTALLLGGGFYAGYTKASQEKMYPNYSADVMEPKEHLDANFALFWEAWYKLKSKHIDAPGTGDQDFVYGAIAGLAGTFKDPHTSFFEPVEAEQFNQDVRGSFGGIGAEIGMRDDRLTIIAPLKGSPAEKAGLMSGDLVLKVDETNIDGFNLTEAIDLIRGEVGTKVVLNIFRESSGKAENITITRGNIKVPTLDIAFYDDDEIARISLYSFNQNAPSVFYEAVGKALSQGSKGLVLDLRDNPGGFLEVANNLAGWFLEDGTLVVSERFRSGDDSQFLASGNGALKDMPAVVLINQGSASASEILAGALRDQRQIKLVGKKSFGKGTVQELVELSDKSNLKITVAKWVLPNGHILTEGLEPDFDVDFTQEDFDAGIDPQLEKALEVLRGEIK